MKALIVALALVSALTVKALAETRTNSRQIAEKARATEEAALLAKLSKTQRRHAEAAIAGHLPVFDANQRESMKKGEIGSLEIRFQEVFYEWHTTEAGRVRVAKTQDGTRKDFTIDDVIDDRNMLVFGHKLWIEGIDTRDLANDTKIDLSDHVFEVKGTKEYETVDGGTNTVKNLALVDMNEATKVVQRIRDLREHRIWEDSTGKFSVRAKFLEMKGGKVHLRSLDGKENSLPLSRLSKKDRDWVRAEVKRRRAGGA